MPVLGNSTQVLMEDGKQVPSADECPACGGTEFKDVHEDSLIETGHDD